MFRLPTLAALLAFAVSPIMAQAAENEAVTFFTLDNGMDVVVVEDHRAPAVQQMVWYRAGSADEPKGSSGVAHFLEHLLFKATDKMESGEFSATVAANGGRDNAFTSYDYTAYFQRVAADRLELMMQMESDRMKNIRLTPENIRTERDVILEERNQRTDSNPSALFSEQMNAAQYLNHRYGTPVIGWRHEMETLDLDDALAFYELYYSPNNAILVVSGDVDPEKVRMLAEKYYGVIPANPDLPERLRTQEPPQTAERRLIFRDGRVAQPYVSRAYLAPERDPGAQEAAAALTILAEILGGGTTSVLAEKLQFDEQIATYTGAFYRGSTLDDTAFDLVVVPAAGVTLQEAEDAMDAALSSFMETGVDAAQLDRIKLQIRAEQIYARDNAEGVANRYGSALAIGLTVEDVQNWPDVLEAVTAEDIMQAAEKLFDRRASVTGWLMKEEAAQ
ncbi:insulinase family protein [Sulfitobacter sp. M57]|nr:insulinase family protein [Sulfitobacter sp. KE5]MDF3422871.1 insulinase family protein [Sulfitobacter sp. KE43]MDF3433936.1 insulinase family protein [Sulfitobacter sp. KE42]MDF3459576.1 insulinase family protein [Sulfitobacter sp. S74]MDF3463475.1 insulinase family protein [Sulfitobacter sp. Ks18]MDF3467375.1 insulinase family protein [Sulfitobacter sp. M05]MDF3471270.1 insulinase family protein [Sulfitobacter sp. M28]MDF3475019.1 insulinase family protein [Sulfitobacter sp. M48]MDF347